MEEKKHNIQISDNLYKKIKDYTSINNLKFNTYVENLLKSQFMIDVYGDTPFSKKEKSKETTSTTTKIPFENRIVSPTSVTVIAEKDTSNETDKEEILTNDNIKVKSNKRRLS